MDGDPSGTDGFPNYAKEKEKCKEFLQQYRTPTFGKAAAAGDAKYVEMVARIAQAAETRFQVDLDDVQLHDPELVKNIMQGTKRYADLFATGIDEMLPEPSRVLGDGSIQDVLQIARISRLDANPEVNADGEPVAQDQLVKYFPPKLLRRYDVRFVPLSSAKSSKLRDISAAHIGKFVSAECIVIRATDVKPLIEVAVYACDVCGYETYQEVVGKSFMPLSECVSESCRTNKTCGAVRLQLRGSKFVKYQELRVQELPDQVPVGHIPRSVTVVCRSDTTRLAAPGDVVVLSGVFLPTPFTGFQSIKAGLIADTYIEAHDIRKKKKADIAFLDADMEERINAVADADPYNALSRSIAPEIFGMEDVKKALLLQLVGGVTQQQRDGMRTRGDINICLMGDPGVAKSQLLKHIAKLSPRAVYTTGRGSSGVGLTASVLRDPLTQELTLEGGSLVLADMGICCIDEFDKMDEGDRTAIHEVMEQQTVSIAKAGITTTLNARTAILAAANPRYGRYNRRADPDAHVALQKNINLPAALLSRFDLLFLLLDEVDADDDRALATHVTHVHQNETHPPLVGFEPLSGNFIRQYLVIAKHIAPTVPRHLKEYIVKHYVDMRARDKGRAAASGSRSVMTPRQLLSVMRLSQALARLEMRLDIVQKDVDEAIRLVNVSKASVVEPDGGAGGAGARAVDGDYMSRLWALVRDRALADGAQSVAMADAVQMAEAAGFGSRQLGDFLAEYEGLQLVAVNPSRTRIDLVVLDC